MDRMSSPEHRRWRELIGAYVLGHLEGDAVTGFTAHLDGCEACRAEVRELEAVAETLPGARPDPPDRPGDPPPHLAEAVVARIAAERAATRRKRARRYATRGLLGAAAAFALLVGIVTVFGERGEQVRFAHVPEGVEVAAVLTPNEGGTAIELTVDGLEPGTLYGVWVEREDGQRVPAGTFTASDEPVNTSFTAGLERRKCNGVGVSALPEGEDVIWAELETW